MFSSRGQYTGDRRGGGGPVPLSRLKQVKKVVSPQRVQRGNYHRMLEIPATLFINVGYGEIFTLCMHDLDLPSHNTFYARFQFSFLSDNTSRVSFM